MTTLILSGVSSSFLMTPRYSFEEEHADIERGAKQRAAQ